MATITFMRASDAQPISNSGIGGYGSSFGQSVNVGNYADSMYATSSDGTVQGISLGNVKWAHANSGYVGASLLNLLAIPNVNATLRINFNHTSQVLIQNPRLMVTNRSNATGQVDGLTCKVAEINHTGATQVANGIGNTSWSTLNGSGYLGLTANPGSGGSLTGQLYDHNWWIGLSMSPDTVASKYGLLRFSCEYV